MDCPECGKALSGKISKDTITYTCEECRIILSDLEEDRELKPNLKIKEVVKLVFREPETYKYKDHFLTRGNYNIRVMY